MTPVTIRDVAKRAKVGVGTVSRVLNNSPSVREETRRRVLEAMEVLDYSPNLSARRLSLGRTLTIGVVLPLLTLPSFVERLRGVQQALRESEYDLVLFDAEDPTRRDRYFEELANQSRADGLIIISLPPTDDQVERFLKAGVPTVLVDADHPGLSRVIVDDVQGGYLATQHLLGLGHRKIAYLSDYLENPLHFVSMRHRLEGYHRALREAGVAIRSEYHREGEHSREGARSMALNLLALPDPPTAIFAASDTQAIGVMDAAQERGLSIPADLSVIGYDDIRDASYLNLTTIYQPLFDSGVQGVNLLLESLQNPGEKTREVLLPIELIPRATTAAPPA
jgi:DNA-binding LacI/PurR family transcriptional regulator